MFNTLAMALGHTSISIAADIYGHVAPDVSREVARLSEALEGKMVVKNGGQAHLSARLAAEQQRAEMPLTRRNAEWEQPDSNGRPLVCKTSALTN